MPERHSSDIQTCFLKPISRLRRKSLPAWEDATNARIAFLAEAAALSDFCDAPSLVPLGAGLVLGPEEYFSSICPSGGSILVDSFRFNSKFGGKRVVLIIFLENTRMSEGCDREKKLEYGINDEHRF